MGGEGEDDWELVAEGDSGGVGAEGPYGYRGRRTKGISLMRPEREYG